MPAADLLLRGKIARETLALLLSTPGQQLHTREIARRVKADAHPVQRALEQLLDAGLVESRRLGNLRLWAVNDRSALVPAVRDVLRQTAGIAERLRTELSRMRGVHLAFLFGSYASGQDELESDIDLFLVGAPDWDELSRTLATLAAEVSREINPVVWTLDELERPTPTQRRFIDGLTRRPRIWIVGDDDELERLRTSMGTALGRGEARAPRPRGRSRRPKAARSR